jgi:Ca-activated chloride channel family protein
MIRQYAKNALDWRFRFWKSCFCLPIPLCIAVITCAPPLNSQSEGLMNATAGRQRGQPSLAGSTTKSLQVDVNVVLVPVVVTDGANHSVTGLEKQNFAIYEDNEQQEIQYFSTEDSPISVGLLLDLSESMSNKFDAEREAVSEFFKNANSEDDYFVVTFANHPQLLTEATQSISSIEAKLEAETPAGNTAMLDAISLAMTQMHSSKYKRRALLLISDGGDNHSRHKFREIKRLVRDSDVQVYAIGLFDTGPFKTFEEFMGKAWLSEITDATGGHTITIDNVTKMPEAAATISHEMRDQYLLGYQPSRAASDGKRRQIKVRVINPSSSAVQLQAYYKRGYIIPKQPQ